MGKMMLPVPLSASEMRIYPQDEVGSRASASYVALLLVLLLGGGCAVLAVTELRSWQATVLHEALFLLRQPIATEPSLSVAAVTTELSTSRPDSRLLTLAKAPVIDEPEPATVVTPVVAPVPTPRSESEPQPERLLVPAADPAVNTLQALIKDTAGQPSQRRAELLDLYRNGNISAHLLELLATEYAATKQWTHVTLLLERAIAMRPNDAKLQRNLAVAYDKAGRADKAVAAYRELLRGAAMLGQAELNTIHQRLAFLQGEKNARRKTDRTRSDQP